MRRVRSVVLALAGLYLLANVLYAIKSLAGIDAAPGHHGGLFPLGDRIYRAFGGTHPGP